MVFFLLLSISWYISCFIPWLRTHFISESSGGAWESSQSERRGRCWQLVNVMVHYVRFRRWSGLILLAILSSADNSGRLEQERLEHNGHVSMVSWSYGLNYSTLIVTRLWLTNFCFSTGLDINIEHTMIDFIWLSGTLYPASLLVSHESLKSLHFPNLTENCGKDRLALIRVRIRRNGAAQMAIVYVIIYGPVRALTQFRFKIEKKSLRIQDGDLSFIVWCRHIWTFFLGGKTRD